MSSVKLSGTATLGDRQVYRLGYGAMQPCGTRRLRSAKRSANRYPRPGRKRSSRELHHIDTSDFYGPHITNQLIRQALHPYPDDLCIVTKVSARRDDKRQLATRHVARGAHSGGRR
ncbi:aldo-keto reductase [Klebsiella oxytoca]|nr:aldo-keto reductase [Klebsiella oxytoca]